METLVEYLIDDKNSFKRVNFDYDTLVCIIFQKTFILNNAKFQFTLNLEGNHIMKFTFNQDYGVVIIDENNKKQYLDLNIFNS